MSYRSVNIAYDIKHVDNKGSIKEIDGTLFDQDVNFSYKKNCQLYLSFYLFFFFYLSWCQGHLLFIYLL